MTKDLSAGQTSVLAEIDRQQKQNTTNAKWNFGVGAGMFATSLAVTALFPPAGFIASFTQIYSFLKGWDLLENFSREKSLQRAKAEVTEDATFAKTADRAAKTGATARKLLRATFAVVGLGVAASLAGWLLPALIPVAVAAPVFTAAVTAGLVGVTVHSLLDGAAKGAKSVTKYAEGFKPASATNNAAPTDLSPSPLSNAPSIAPGFGLAANNNAPEAKAAPELKPALTPPAPKP